MPVHLEDMLIQQAQKTDEVTQRAGGMEQILTNPDYLADYTDRFFTEVVPVDIDGDVPLLKLLSSISRTSTCLPLRQPPLVNSKLFNLSSSGNAFGDAMSRSPENAWRMLAQMSPEALRSKLLFMEPS